MDKWGELSLICAEGNFQSPINIISIQAIAQSNNLLAINYDQVKIAIISNLGFEIMALIEEEYLLKYQSNQYKLLQFHFHSDGEHTIDGVNRLLELHLVHSDTNNNLSVIGILFEEGSNNIAFQQFLDNLPEKEGQTKNYNQMIDITQFLPNNKSFYSYDGSLTTPDCTEGVNWIIMKDLVQVSSDQITEFLAFRNNKKNNRIIQDTGNRTIYYNAN